jgi:hypothetical protein
LFGLGDLGAGVVALVCERLRALEVMSYLAINDSRPDGRKKKRRAAAKHTGCSVVGRPAEALATIVAFEKNRAGCFGQQTSTD